MIDANDPTGEIAHLRAELVAASDVLNRQLRQIELLEDAINAMSADNIQLRSQLATAQDNVEAMRSTDQASQHVPMMARTSRAAR